MKGRMAVLAAILLVGTGQAAINDSQPFAAEYPYMDGFTGDEIHIVSGELQANLNHVAGAFGFFEVGAFQVDGLERVCWQGPSRDCHARDPDGGIALQVLDGGSVGLRLPLATDAEYRAAHALGLFVDFASSEDLNSFGVEQTLAAAAIRGEMEFTNIRTVSAGSLFPSFESVAGLVALEDSTVVRLLQDGIVVREFQGKQYQLSMEGNPIIAPFQTDLVILPFEDDSIARFDLATDRAADRGLKVERVNNLMDSLDGANSETSTKSLDPEVVAELEEFEGVMAEVLNGALLRFTIQDGNLTEPFSFVGFENLQVTANMDDLQWQGAAPLWIKNGEVKGAPNLIGFWYFQLPWWSFLLWGLAAGAFAARVYLKPETKHETWDRYKWVGWVFGALMFILVFWLWDLEVRKVWGTSLFSTDATGLALVFTALVQIAPLLFVLFAAAAPLRILMKNSLLLGKQGTFMGVSTGVAYLIAYLIGATLLLAYIEIIMQGMLEYVGG